ncbi:hypothetical protein KKE28_00980, partial [Patescibacteria group bacterium]|nr:hypothetical protein [Patescibacteria group bacterium]
VGLIKYVLDSNPELKAKLLKWLVATISPKIMDLYLRQQTAKAQKSQKNEAKRQKPKPASETKTSETEPAADDQTDDPDLIESASETADMAYRKARRVTGRAGRKAADFLARAREWLEETTETEEAESPAKSDRRAEDDELAALKQKMRADKGSARCRQSPTTHQPVPPDHPTTPTPAEPEKLDPESDQEPDEQEDLDETDDRAAGQLPGESFSDYLKRLLEKEKQTKRDQARKK